MGTSKIEVDRRHVRLMLLPNSLVRPGGGWGAGCADEPGTLSRVCSWPESDVAPGKNAAEQSLRHLC